MGQAYLGNTEINQLWLGNTQINQVVGPPPVPGEGLVAYYLPAFPDGYSGNTIFDLSGKGNNLILSGSYSFVDDTMVLASSSNAVSQYPYVNLTGNDPKFTFVIFMNLTQSLYNNHWYLGTGSNAIFDAQSEFATFSPDKIIIGSNADNDYWTAYSGNNSTNILRYSRTEKTMLAIRRDISSSFSSVTETLNGSVYIRNYNLSSVDVNNNYETNKVSNSLINGNYLLEGNSPLQPLNIDWSTASPKLYIGSNPADNTFTGQINFGAAFIYNRLLSNTELEQIYSYVGEYVNLPAN